MSLQVLEKHLNLPCGELGGGREGGIPGLGRSLRTERTWLGADGDILSALGPRPCPLFARLVSLPRRLEGVASKAGPRPSACLPYDSRRQGGGPSPRLREARRQATDRGRQHFLRQILKSSRPAGNAGLRSSRGSVSKPRMKRRPIQAGTPSPIPQPLATTPSRATLAQEGRGKGRIALSRCTKKC